jgi:hypothetical protein
MRDGWTRDSNYLLLDCGPHGASTSAAAHAHADALSFDLAARGRTLLVDPGTYTYTGSAELRDHFRTTAAHNTLTVDNESSSAPGSAFTWRSAARASLKSWRTHPRFDLFAGEHDGYARLAWPVAHARSVLFLKGDYWIMRDRAEAAGGHLYDLNFHFAPDAAPVVTARAGDVDAVRESGGEGNGEDGDAPGLDLFAFTGGQTYGGSWHRAEDWVSQCYRARQSAPVYTFSARGEGACEFITFLVPRDGTSQAQAHEIEAVGGRAFELRREAVGNPQDDETADGGANAGVNAYDLILMGEGGGMVESPRMASDFAWTWARFARATGELTELVLIDGSRLNLAGRECLRATSAASAGRIGYLTARRTDDGWELETDAAREFVFTPPGEEGARRQRTLVNGRVYSGSSSSSGGGDGGDATAAALSYHGL